MDFRLLREHLRTHRNALGLTLDQAAEESGINRHTIHKIENVKREPDVQPELDTIERLVCAYGLTLAKFFTEIERSQDPALKTESAAAQNRALPLLRVPLHGGRSVSSSAPIPEEDVRTFLRVLRDALGGSIASAIERAQRDEQSTAGHRARRAKRRKAG